jgi:hypothetical protein
MVGRIVVTNVRGREMRCRFGVGVCNTKGMVPRTIVRRVYGISKVIPVEKRCSRTGIAVITHANPADKGVISSTLEGAITPEIASAA